MKTTTKTSLLFLFALPVYALMLLSGQKDFTSNPLMGSVRLNRWGLHVGRKRLAHTTCQLRRWFMRHRLSAELVSKYHADGFIVIPNFLTDFDVAQVKHDLCSLAQTAIEMKQTPALTRRFNLDELTCRGYPALQKLITNQNLLDLLHYVAGYRGAPIVAVQCIHTDGPGQQHDPQTEWHADTFHSTGKAWLFLHDVGLQDGPFAYVPGSHNPTPQRLLWESTQSQHAAQHPNRLHSKGSFRASEADLQTMGFGEPVVGAVKANTLVVADTSGFHRRTPSPTSTVRVEIYLSLRRNPYFAGLYPSLLGLPWIRRRWATLAINLYRWQKKRGKATWHACAATGLSPTEQAKLHSPTRNQ